MENRSNCLSRRWVWYAKIYFAWIGIALVLPGSLRGDSLEDGIRLLGRRVAGVTRGSVVSIKEQNRSGLRDAKQTELFKVFADELRRNGIGIAVQEGEASITFTISENNSGYVGVAQVRRGEASQELVQFLGRSLEETKGPQNWRVTLKREFLFSSQEPMLDVGNPDGDVNGFMVLCAKELDYYNRGADGWKMTSKTILPRVERPGRNLKGQLSFETDDITVEFAADYCILSTHDGNECNSRRVPENVSQVRDDILKDRGIPPGREAIELHGAQAMVIVAGKDGKLRFYRDDVKAFLTVAEFGDQITHILSDCGLGQQVMVTGRGDEGESDTIQAIEIHDDEIVPMGAAVSFDGPVEMLRAATRGTDISPAAIAVVRNLQSGNYEAYRLTITCGN